MEMNQTKDGPKGRYATGQLAQGQMFPREDIPWGGKPIEQIVNRANSPEGIKSHLEDIQE